jgi:S-formylglutathione hydrolase FrmB
VSIQDFNFFKRTVSNLSDTVHNNLTTLLASSLMKTNHLKPFSTITTILLVYLSLVSMSTGQARHRWRSTPTTWVTEAVQGPGLHYRTFFSQTVQSDVSYHIYLPPSYDKNKQQRYPVLYWLHGLGSGTQGLPRLALIFNGAIESKKIPPMIIVFPGGDKASMWCDWKDGSKPTETVLIKELLPDVEAHFRTVASREGRLIEGFSMGGYGAARLGFKYPELFGAISILSGGPLQPEFTFTPRANERARKQILNRVYGGDMEYFKEQSPWRLAEQNADRLQEGVLIRQVIGDQDEMLAVTRDFNAHLESLNIPNTYIELAGVDHNPLNVFAALGEDNWAFYRKAFSSVTNKTDTTVSKRFH